PLFIDGARLAYGRAADGTEVTLRDVANLSDVFYIGGTKCGALFGEAVVSRRPELLPRFDSLMKLHGGLLAKGRLVPLQFITLFSDNLYYRIGRHADRLAIKLKQGFIEKGYRVFIDSPTNQQFFVMPNTKIDLLKTEAGIGLWGPPGETESVVRFVTDWSTTEEDIDNLLSLI
ncbi:MAG: low specificity L-threonine aldolase, partial [Muribaculaceae bacterium]|nr:low specificity L-threonine aldolase [Muribaculaceae bacterium]